MLDAIDHLLDDAIALHEEKKFSLASKKYLKILEQDALHADTNHNFGLLKVELGLKEEALTFLQTAINTNPNVLQYWVTFINTLTNAERFDDARSVLEQAHFFGHKDQTLNHLEHNLDLAQRKYKTLIKPDQFNVSQSVKAEQNTSKISQLNAFIQGSEKHQTNTLDEMKLDKAIKLAKKKVVDGLIGEANKIYQDILVKFPKNKRAINGLKGLAAVPQDQQQAIINLYRQGQLKQVLQQAKILLQQFPNSSFLYNISGAAYKRLDQLDEAVEAYNKALSIKPNNADAYYNIGIALKDQGKPDEAVEAYKKALSIKPEYADAYNNMGNALKDQGKPDEAVEAYKKALSIKPEYADAYYNIGIALKDQGKPDEAVEAYKKALSIKPEYADAYYNIGIALKDQGKPDEAVEAYNKALSIKPNYIKAYNNMGNILIDQGKFEEAIEAFTKALSINPDYDDAWNNLYFPLQAIKCQKKSDQSLKTLYPKDINSKYGNIQLGLLDYRLNFGQESKRVYLSRALETLSSAENISIKNPTFDKNAQAKIQSPPDKMAVLVNFGRSGTGLMHSLIDGHPEVSTLPSIYFSEYFDHSTWIKIISSGWDRMVDRFMSIYDVLFDAASTFPVETKGKKLINNIGIKDGMANVGDQRDEVLRVDRKLFRSELNRLINSYDKLDAFSFFKLVNTAYDKAINDLNPKNLIFYHIHNPDTYAQLNFFRLAPQAKWIMMVREPIQSLESWANRDKERNWYLKISNNILSMLFEIDNIIYHNHDSIAVRLEDLKEHPRKTIPALCEWMGIEEHDSLYEMTAQGKKWWGDPTSTDYSKDGMKPFGKTSIKRKLGSIFSENDQFVLRTLFYPFSVHFGYAEQNKAQFKIDLQKIRPMIDELFDFEKKIAQEMQMSCERLIGSGSYLFLRSGLIERWNTLSKFHTYPKMINPLKI